MTPDDLLQQAARELRQRTDRDVVDGVRTRERLLALSGRRKRRRQRWGSATVAMLALLTMSTAWAAATGQMPKLWRAVVHRLTGAPQVAREQARATSIAPAPEATSALPIPPSLPAVTAGPKIENVPEKRRGPTASPRSQKEPDREERLFRAAYHEHFVVRDPQSALNGWDAYLRAASDGRFALEAYYNRALCLVRLGRRAEAIAALTPFADGTHGEYRRREASRLINALATGASK
jgi:hypothetical protein